jgi:hypothetical protein
MTMRRVTPTLSYSSTMSITNSLHFLLGSCVLILLAFPCEGWIPIATPLSSLSRYSYGPPHPATTTTTTAKSSPNIGIGIGMGTDSMRLDASSSPLPDENFDDDNLPRKIYRAACSGVSVSETGFWVILRVASDKYWPVQVTTSVADQTAAASPEALTLLQLLAGVDIAGAILAPEILARIIVGVCDTYEYDEYGIDQKGNCNSQRIRDLVRRSSNWPDQAPVAKSAYLELPEWTQSRIRLPVCTLDEIQYHQETGNDGSDGGGIWEYQCQVQDVGPQTVIPTCNVLQKVAWSDADPLTATAAVADAETCGEQAAFFALALALRYKTPIRLSLSNSAQLLSNDQVVEQFPLYRSRDKLQETCATVTVNIERGLKIHQLQAALQIALQKQDKTAAAKIRVVLDEMDSLQDLPVQPETDTRNMQ